MTSPAELFRNRAKARVGTMVLDKWRLDALLGIGGTAAVYAGTHRNGKRVAVKILRSELTSYEEVTTRFAREGYLANKIEHPGVVSVDDDDVTEDGAPFLVMELLEGHSLDRYTKGAATALPLERVTMIIDRVLDVLSAAHAKHIVHRDIKPANIFLGRNDDVKVLDFGIARIADSLEAGMTQTGTAIGTPGYMAPEQARGRWNEVDARTDLWAVGATMYALLIGQRPHRAETVQEELLAAMTQPMPSIVSALPSLAPEVAAFIDKSVAFDRHDRFPDAAAMQAALRNITLQQYAPRASAPPPLPRSEGDRPTSAAPLAVPSARGSSRQLQPVFEPHPNAIDFVDEVTVASAPSWQLPIDDHQSGSTAYPFTFPSQPVAQPVPSVRTVRTRGVWLVGGTLALSLGLAVVLLVRRPDNNSTSGTMPLASFEPSPVQGASSVAPAGGAVAPTAGASVASPVPPVPDTEPAAPAANVAPSASVAPPVAPPVAPHKRKNPPAAAQPTTPPPPKKVEDPRCRNPETAPPSCYR